MADETWLVGATIPIDQIQVIESLPGGWAGRTGSRPFDELGTLCGGTPVKPLLHRIDYAAGLVTLGK